MKLRALFPGLALPAMACSTDGADSQVTNGPSRVATDVGTPSAGGPPAGTGTRSIPSEPQSDSGSPMSLEDESPRTATPPEIVGNPAPVEEPRCDGADDPAGCPCEDFEGCASGFCMALEAGKACVDLCVDSCPSGFSCVGIPTPPEMTFVCLPRFARLCQPCTDHGDCQGRGDDGAGVHSVYCRAYLVDGMQPFGDRFAATGHSTAHHQLNARVHWLPDGRFLLAYDTVDANIDDFWGISVRAYNAFGFDDGPRRRANRTASGDQRLGFLIPVSTNRVWTGWTGTDSDGAGIRYRVLERF